MTVSRCSNCNAYETAKTSNFKRHVERCLSGRGHASSGPDDSIARFTDQAPAAARETTAAVTHNGTQVLQSAHVRQNAAEQREHTEQPKNAAQLPHDATDARTPTDAARRMAPDVVASGKKRTVQLTNFDSMQELSSDGDSAWERAPSDRLRSYMARGLDEPTLVSTPRPKPLRTEALSGPPAKRRNDGAVRRDPSAREQSMLDRSERDYLITRVDELERLVMKLQHAVCVMDSRMQQFRMATSSWQPVTSDD